MSAVNDRWCPTGNHYRLARFFRVKADGRPARDCLDCEERRQSRILALAGERRVMRGAPAPQEPKFPGVDIDAVHYKRGAVRKRA